MDITKSRHLFLTHFRKMSSSKYVRRDHDHFNDDGGLIQMVRAAGKALNIMQCVNNA